MLFCRARFQKQNSGEHAASPSDDLHPSAATLALGATPMDGWQSGSFSLATFFGGLTSGLSGFAMGLVVSGVWLHIMSPQQTALLIVLCGLVTQGSGIWRVRHAISWRAVLPYIIGGAFGIPAGTALVTTVNPDTIRLGIGVLLLGLQSLQPDPAGLQTVQGERSCGPWRRRRQRPDRRTDRPRRHCSDRLVPAARRTKGCATRDLSTGAVRDLCHDGSRIRGCWHLYSGNAQALCVRASGADCRHLVRLRALRKA